MPTPADLQAALDQLQTDVTAGTTIKGSVITLLTGLKTQLDAAIAALANGGVSDAQLAQLKALSGSLETDAADYAAAILANTPAPASAKS